MKVIEGKQGKSRLLEEILKTYKKSEVLLYDKVGCYALWDFAEYTYSIESLEDMLEDLSEDGLQEEFHKLGIKLLCLELNAPEMVLERIRDIEVDFGIDVIVTIQKDCDLREYQM